LNSENILSLFSTVNGNVNGKLYAIFVSRIRTRDVTVAFMLLIYRDVSGARASRYFTGSVMSRLARLVNIVPIDPDVHLLQAMRAGAAALRHGRILNIYPEGRRSFDGQLGDFVS